MSRHSKTRRDARRKKSTAAPPRRARPALEPHAELAVDGVAVGVVARQQAEWLMFLDGRPLPPTGSAAMTMAMLKRVAQVRESQGGEVRLVYSTTLRRAATAEAEAHGHALHAWLAQLEAERAARPSMADGAAGDGDPDAGVDALVDTVVRATDTSPRRA